MIYDPAKTLKECRKEYFAQSGFDTKTYSDRWVKMPILGFAIYLYNFQARKVCVPLHDIDHIVTGYDTDWPGEFQISAYEIGTGVGPYWFGWIINFQGMLGGLAICPCKTLLAFARGRRSKSIYKGYVVNDQLLSRRLGDLKSELRVSDPLNKASLIDLVTFTFLIIFALFVNLAPVAVLTAVFRIIF